MVDPTSRSIGSYNDAVLALRTFLREARSSRKLSEHEKLEVVVFGHGGRDTTCCLALVEAMAKDDKLSSSVRVAVYSCSWPHDEWEVVMQAYIQFLISRNVVASDSAKE